MAVVARVVVFRDSRAGYRSTVVAVSLFAEIASSRKGVPASVLVQVTPRAAVVSTNDDNFLGKALRSTWKALQSALYSFLR